MAGPAQHSAQGSERPSLRFSLLCIHLSIRTDRRRLTLSGAARKGRRWGGSVQALSGLICASPARRPCRPSRSPWRAYCRAASPGGARAPGGLALEAGGLAGSGRPCSRVRAASAARPAGPEPSQFPCRASTWSRFQLQRPAFARLASSSRAASAGAAEAAVEQQQGKQPKQKQQKQQQGAQKQQGGGKKAEARLVTPKSEDFSRCARWACCGRYATTAWPAQRAHLAGAPWLRQRCGAPRLLCICSRGGSRSTAPLAPRRQVVPGRGARGAAGGLRPRARHHGHPALRLRAVGGRAGAPGQGGWGGAAGAWQEGGAAGRDGGQAVAEQARAGWQRAARPVPRSAWSWLASQIAAAFTGRVQGSQRPASAQRPCRALLTSPSLAPLLPPAPPHPSAPAPCPLPPHPSTARCSRRLGTRTLTSRSSSPTPSWPRRRSTWRALPRSWRWSPRVGRGCGRAGHRGQGSRGWSRAAAVERGAGCADVLRPLGSAAGRLRGARGP